jgi:hypothetical protein
MTFGCAWNQCQPLRAEGSLWGWRSIALSAMESDFQVWLSLAYQSLAHEKLE